MTPLVGIAWQGARLHIGCGAKYLTDWINSDGQAQPVVEGVVGHPDVVLDVYADLAAIPSDSLAHVYWSHGIEHLYRDRVVSVLGELRRVLRSGGLLTLATTSLRGVYEYRYLSQADGPYWNEAIFGETNSTDHPFASHKLIFDDALLRQCLTLAGFASAAIHSWEPEKYPEIAALADYSTTARKVSLLLEARK
jgi:predicted SAM-dependent methyltransferase